MQQGAEYWDIYETRGVILGTILGTDDPDDLGDGYWYIDMGDSIISSSFSFTIFSSRFTEFP